jgi:hypothetical protein
MDLEWLDGGEEGVALGFKGGEVQRTEGVAEVGGEQTPPPA